MNCKKCNAQVGPIVAAETARAIRSTCEALGFDAEAVDAVVDQLTPLCRACMQQWGVDEDDLAPPEHRVSAPESKGM